jgi:hypothetical protein
MKQSCQLWLFATFFVSHVVAFGQEGSFKKALSEIATRKARDVLTETWPAIDTDLFSGTLKAVDPDRNLGIKVKDFELRNDRASANLIVSLKCQLVGKVRSDHGKQEVSIDLDADLDVSVSVTLTTRNGKFYLKAMVSDLAIKAIRIDEVKPKDLSRDGKKAEGALRDAFKVNKDTIIQYLNRALPEQQLK